MSVYSDAVLQDSPFIYWKLDELSGSIATDSSINGNDGTYYSGFTFGQTSLVAGDGGNAVLKTTNNGYVYTSAFSNVTIRAMEIWFTTTSIVANACPISVCQSTSARVLLVTTAANRLGVYSGSAGGFVMYQDDPSLDIDTIYHCVLFYNSSDNKTHLMLNGIIQSSSLTGNLMAQAATAPIFYAAAYLYSSPYAYMRGNLDEAAFYVNEVSASRFQFHYTLGTSPYYFSGYVYEKTTPVSRIVRAYRRDTGAFINNTTSSGNGAYYMLTTYSGEHYIIALDDESGDSYNAAVLDRMTPVLIGS